MTDAPSPSRAGPLPKKNPLQWLILVFWTGVVVGWTWFISAFAAIDTRDGNPSAIVLWVIAVIPAVVVAWRYPTGKLFRSGFALVSFSYPTYLAADALVRAFHS